MTRWAMVGEGSPDLLSWRGKILVHDNKAELEYLIDGVRVVECPRDIPPAQTLQIRYHPGFASVRWPLARTQFRSP